MKNIKFWAPLIIAVAVVAGMLLGSTLNFPSTISLKNDSNREAKLKQLINFIDYEYVDVVNTDSLLDLTIQDLLHRLDPHSSYISLAEVQAAEENIQGNFEGIGIEFTTVRDSLTVLRVIDDGPSEKAGVMAGDRIIIVGTDTIAGVKMNNSNYIRMLKGPTGSVVEIEVYRPLKDSLITISITRGQIPLPSVDLVKMVDEQVGVIKVNRFAETTFDEFTRALDDLLNQGMTKLILDLRDNPGGLLFTANDMADQFLNKGDLIVYTINRKGEKEEAFATDEGRFKTGELVVLINENSASASEIIAGALQDNDRATIVGRRSFGKGLVQEEMELKDGSRVRLTTSRYYTPTGRSIQKPYGEDYTDYQKDAHDRYTNGELFEKDSIKVNEEEKFTTPGGKVVYGGGGIIPDTFVSVDTAIMGRMYHLFSAARVDYFAFSFIDNNREDYLDYTLESFVNDFEVDDKTLNEFMDSIGVENYKSVLDEHTQRVIRLRLKAMIGRNLFGSRAYFATMLSVDPMIIKSLEIL